MAAFKVLALKMEVRPLPEQHIGEYANGEAGSFWSCRRNPTVGSNPTSLT